MTKEVDSVECIGELLSVEQSTQTNLAVIGDMVVRLSVKRGVKTFGDEPDPFSAILFNELIAVARSHQLFGEDDFRYVPGALPDCI
jgi:hypothetical protein